MAALRREVRIGIAFPFDNAQIADFESISSRLRFVVTNQDDQSGIDEVASRDLDGLVGASLPSDRSSTPSLRWLQILSAGVENVVRDGRDWPTDIVLTNARGAFAASIAQYTMGAILRIAERVELRRDQQVRRLWRSVPTQALEGQSIRGQTLVVVGYGGIGREIARLAAAHGMRILAVKSDPSNHVYDGFLVPGTGDPEGTIPERITGVQDLREAAREADYLSVTVPMTPLSRGIITRQILDAMPVHAWIINTGRGPVIDEIALAASLAAGRIGGAVLDVFGEEPLPQSSPFWHLPNVVITPHIAGVSSENMAALVAANLRRFVAGEPLLNRVDPSRGY